MTDQQRDGVLVVGIGNEFRGDDGAGLVATRRLKSLSLTGVSFVELHNEVTSLPDHLDSRDAVIIVDAVHGGSHAGSVHRFDLSHGPLPGQHNQRSTHGISLGSILEIARAQGILPPTTIVYGIEGSSFHQGPGLSPDVEQSMGRLVEEILRVLQGFSEKSKKAGGSRQEH